MKLYSYCLRYDGGSAPNPFWGICTLVICKPAIRRTANIGDWVVGLGSANSPIGDISTSVVYAMEVTDKLTLREYDEFCKASLPGKIPNQASPDYRLQSGDCIYDYGTGNYPKIRPMQGHKSIQNQPYAQSFVNWIESLEYRKNKLYGIPQFVRKSLEVEGQKSTCSVRSPQMAEREWRGASC